MAVGLSLEEAKCAFTDLINNIEPTASNKFATWLKKEWNSGKVRKEGLPESDANSHAEETLEEIRTDIRMLLPPNAEFPSEKIIFPQVGHNSDCDPKHTINVDAFLYDDDMVDHLCSEGKLARSYCRDCNSHNTVPINYISHSMSQERLKFIFTNLLPNLEGLTVLDVGSRLGSVLYGAYVYSTASKIVGVEMNEDFCHLQEKIVKKYNMDDRIEIVHESIFNSQRKLCEANVVVMNNVFDFFMKDDDKSGAWLFMKDTIVSGTLLVTVPPLSLSLEDCGVQLDGWVNELEPLGQPEGDVDEEEVCDIQLYMII